MREKYSFATLHLSLWNFVLKDRETQELTCIYQGWPVAITNIFQTFMAHYDRSLFLTHAKSNVDVPSQAALLVWAVF